MLWHNFARYPCKTSAAVSRKFNPEILKISICFNKVKAWRWNIVVYIFRKRNLFKYISGGFSVSIIIRLLPLLTMSPLHSPYCPLLYAACFVLMAWDNNPHFETDLDFLPPSSLAFLTQSRWLDGANNNPVIVSYCQWTLRMIPNFSQWLDDNVIGRVKSFSKSPMKELLKLVTTRPGVDKVKPKARYGLSTIELGF